MSEQLLTEALSDLPLTGCRFVSIGGYESKGDGAVANYTINAGINYGNAVKADTAFLKSYEILTEDVEELTAKLKDKDLKGKSVNDILVEAKYALISSILKETDSSKVRSKAQTDAYEEVGPALRRNKKSGDVSIYGLVHSKTVTKPSTKEKKVVNSAPLTIAKNFISVKYLKKSKFRSLLIDNATTARVNGETLLLD